MVTEANWSALICMFYRQNYEIGIPIFICILKIVVFKVFAFITVIDCNTNKLQCLDIEISFFFSRRIIDKKLEKGATEPLSSIPPYILQMSNTPTPPRSPASSSSPTHVKNTDQITTVGPVHPSSPSGPNSADEPLENGGGDSDKENTVETEENVAPPQVLSENVEESEPQVKEVMEDEHQQEGEEQAQLQVAETVVEAGAELEGKHKKSKKKKNKRKTNRHDSEEERDGKEGRKRKDRRHSHRSQDGKSADTEKEIIHNVPNEVGINVEGEKVEDSWAGNSLKVEAVKNRSKSRSRSKSIDKEDTEMSGNIFDNILPFDPSVPPPGAFVQSPPKETFYSVPSTYASAGKCMIIVLSIYNYCNSFAIINKHL